MSTWYWPGSKGGGIPRKISLLRRLAIRAELLYGKQEVGKKRRCAKPLLTARSGLSATLPEPRDSGIWFDSDAIIDRRPNPLLAAKVSLGCLNRDMSQQELDLLQFAS